MGRCGRQKQETGPKVGSFDAGFGTGLLVREYADEILVLSPTALRFLKNAFAADTEHLAGTGRLAFTGLWTFSVTDEAHEGVAAFNEKRAPDFGTFRARASV